MQRRRDRLGPHFTYEIIVVDDGSKDATARVAVQYTQKHGPDAVRVLRVSENRGKVSVQMWMGRPPLGS